MHPLHQKVAWGRDFGTGLSIDIGGLLKYALEAGLTCKSNGKLIFDGYISTLDPDVVNPKDGIITFAEIVNYVKDYNQKTDWAGEIVYELGFGDPAVFTLDMWNPTGFRTADFVGGLATSRKATLAPMLHLLLD